MRINSDGLLDTVTSPSRTQDWSLDAMGNWSTLTTNGTGQSRTHNSQNQVTGVGSSTLTYDADGSLTADGAGRIFIYDAWNRLVSVRNTANSPIVEYEVDALGRRIVEDRPNANTVDHLYYSSGWQVLEERRDGTSSSDVRRQYFWSIDYVDVLTARVDYASGAVSATYHEKNGVAPLLCNDFMMIRVIGAIRGAILNQFTDSEDRCNPNLLRAR